MASLVRVVGVSAFACLGVAGSAAPSLAQELGSLASSTVPSGSQMLLEADTLIYDNDNNTVTAAGGVRIEYGGNRLVAKRVDYDRKTSKLVASGDVQVIDKDGTKVFADTIDITDDFANGFVNSLRVETIDKTYFAAESAERVDGLLTTFNNGVYTACKPCEEKPDKAPIWRVKARKIIWDSKAKVVKFERSRFEFFGLPIAGLPYFQIADPTVKRKSGFLIPGISFSDELGTGVTVPYYLALSPTYDLTLRGTYYSKQGFLGDAEWRQRFDNGDYSIRIAGIRQNDPDAFLDNGRTENSGTLIDPNRFRGMIGTKGNFGINPRWQFGWDILAQTDKNFAYTYGINGYSQYYQQSQIYLTGLDDRNYFDLRAMRFQVQEDNLDFDPDTGLENSNATNDKQPWVLPTLDYSYTPDEPVFGGELNFDMNLRSMHRTRLDADRYGDSQNNQEGTVRGIEGSSSRITAEAEWKRSFITDGGLIVTPLLAFQADAIGVDQSQESIQAINAMAGVNGDTTDIRSSYGRTMATAGMEMSWPVLFASLGGGSHVVEPMAQVFARPNEAYGTTLGIPNEDAQSFVFDATTLFERDKFSGYDRVEGGSRANVGLRYSGAFGSGWGTNALVGQSYHLGGLNSFASPDLVNAGAFSGLESERSDYVGLAGITTPVGFSASVGGRFDEQSFELRRSEAKAGYSTVPFSVTGSYTFIQAQPLYGFSEDRHETTVASSIRFHENWRTFGSATYDLQRSMISSDAVGFAYDDECFSYTLTMATSYDVDGSDDPERTFGFNVSFRTIGDFGSSSGAFAQQ